MPITQLADQYLTAFFELYSVAAEKNIIAAWYSLGRMYEDGRGVPQDKGKARWWLEKAAAYDYSDSASRVIALESGRG